MKSIVGSFNALNGFADFSALAQMEAGVLDDGGGAEQDPGAHREKPPGQINLGYTINLQLPATSDIAVFNAIFKSLREHILYGLTRPRRSSSSL